MGRKKNAEKKGRSRSPARPIATKVTSPSRSPSPARRSKSDEPSPENAVASDAVTATAADAPADSSDPATETATVTTVPEGEFAKRTEELERGLQRRPSLPELRQRHVIEAGELDREAPLVSNVKTRLEHQIVADRLKEQLQTQPNEAELVQSGIIAESSAKVAPSLQAAQRAVSLKQRRHHVNELLAQRPSVQELEATGVRFDGRLASSMAAIARALERHMRGDVIKHLLEQRPEASALEQQGIVLGGVAPSIQATASHMEKDLARILVARKLERRPSVEEMKSHEWFRALPARAQGAISPPHSAADARARYAIALKAAAHLLFVGELRPAECGRLKDRILRDDEEVVAALRAFERENELRVLLTAFKEISSRAA